VSESAYLVCAPCRVKLPLGKPLREPDGPIIRFHDGAEDTPPNSAQPLLTRSLWKFLAEHAGHPVRVKSSYEADFPAIAEFTTLGSDAIGETTLEKYVRDWPG
jgi:hypothetical protein